MMKKLILMLKALRDKMFTKSRKSLFFLIFTAILIGLYPISKLFISGKPEINKEKNYSLPKEQKKNNLEKDQNSQDKENKEKNYSLPKEQKKNNLEKDQNSQDKKDKVNILPTDKNNEKQQGNVSLKKDDLSDQDINEKDNKTIIVNNYLNNKPNDQDNNENNQKEDDSFIIDALRIAKDVVFFVLWLFGVFIWFVVKILIFFVIIALGPVLFILILFIAVSYYVTKKEIPVVSKTVKTLCQLLIDQIQKIPLVQNKAHLKKVVEWVAENIFHLQKQQ